MTGPETTDGQTRRERFKTLTEVELPTRAREQRWPLRLDHCFKRVCLDWAFQDCWYRHVARPAERHIDTRALEQAISCAEQILAGGVEVLRERNRASLTWRGKQGPAGSRASDSRGEHAR